MRLNKFEDADGTPELDTLRSIILDYRAFVGQNTAFHIEYDWWPGSFDSKEQEIDFLLSEFGPDSYETLSKWHDDAVDKAVDAELARDEMKASRNLWRFLAILMGFPYLILYFIWKSST